MASALPPYKQTLLATCLSHRILQFGTFTLKSGRVSPYFFQAGLFSTCSLLSTLGASYAQTIAHDGALAGLEFDVLFGPPYKGIPLVAATAVALHALDPARYRDVGYAFNRKEKKDHGEAGDIVGADLGGKRVLVVDDVMTAGTAMREAVKVIEAAGGTVVGVVVMLDRQERLSEDGQESAVMAVRGELGVPVVAILTLEDLIKGAEVPEEVRGRMREYRERYGAREVNSSI